MNSFVSVFTNRMIAMINITLKKTKDSVINKFGISFWLQFIFCLRSQVLQKFNSCQRELG